MNVAALQIHVSKYIYVYTYLGGEGYLCTITCCFVKFLSRFICPSHLTRGRICFFYQAATLTVAMATDALLIALLCMCL